MLVLLLLLVGLAMLYSASYAQSEYDTSYESTTKYLQKQALCAAIGLAAMYFFSRIPAEIWYRAAWPLYGISIVLLLSVLVIGEEVNGARRWINIAGIQFQPSEIAKFTMGGLGDFLADYESVYICKNFTRVNTILENLEKEYPNCAFASAKGLGANPDNLHFSAASLFEFGERYYEAFKRFDTGAVYEGDTSMKEAPKSAMEML